MYFTLKDVELKEKRVLVRVDFNVPIKNGVIGDDSRIRKALPTIEYILKKKAKQVIICSHLGRPDGEYKPEDSLKPVHERLETLLGQKVFFENNPRINNIVQVSDDKIVLLENLRFDKVEEDNDEEFAKKLSSFADVFVLDAFGTAHRAHASVVGSTKYLPSCAGLLMDNEIKFLREAVTKPKRPFVAIIGGAKADKIGVITSLIQKVDVLIIGGVLANTFLKAKGIDIGNSKIDKESLDFDKERLAKYKNVSLSVDFILGRSYDKNTESRVAGISDDLRGWMILDIGPYTITGYSDILKKSKTITWAGPIGVYEFDKFRRGTWDIARCIAQTNAVKVIGGGDSADAIESFGLSDKMTHVSTGGGASLELLAGNQLPGIVALEENYIKFKK